MRIAFYAPLKPPDHPVPSGDRRMARLLCAALARGGHQVDIGCRLRTYDRRGDEGRQLRLRSLGDRMAGRLIRRYGARPAAERPAVWFTYHLYHKSPDWIGPAVADALRIPYVVAEASHAPKRRNGPWETGFAGAEAALRRADAVVGFNRRDEACVRPLLKDDARLTTMLPFLELPDRIPDAADARDRIARNLGWPTGEPWLLTVAMMRPDKLPSFRLLGDALARLADRPWRLIVVGDGTAREQTAAALSPIAERTSFVGEMDETALACFYAAADLMVWPAVNEAYGMALLEAQAAGLPVIAGNAGGVAAIVRHGVSGYLTPEGDGPAFADAVAALLADGDGRRAMGAAARRTAAAEHGLDTAAAALDAVLHGAGA